ncbi:tyrosine--tRNA ligase [Achromobacter denitrificans]|jgi:tyrosyl-tRNA synthetase|uniref:Tyrosine--tRNA ligase n=1 Tax=Achromobacter denitrificans TaxID=32002 RepID=A0ABZ3G120_ACHDE|nr:tyrosine--tRNA ligase [Achromobacter denitrificans]MDX3878693.1 tyrosine--tRNA ligase [Achromobacter sp.]ASC64084.1 tyrosine--tRNA ligase [Achromobacter denitrificans]MBV2158315.1 tyrosine--tRNA ligase [Achromobacter denitrificans]MDF3847516.1 tyrosine--tRNA ligase [Achromobacter denitrificans]MDF3857410.1 tyrosine--tRNA ligase [Achromobacter denitrificans]
MSSSEAPITPEVEADLRIAKRGCDELLVESEFARKLARSRATGVPLRIKLGLDPTAPDIHLGHTVVLNKMRQLQDMGHNVIFLIGDFTSTIGDPSGRNNTRPPLTREQIEANAKTYYAQASLVLDPARTEIRYNSEWCDPLGARGMIQLASRYTVARMMEREDFTKRFKGGIPISVHEFLYPLMQGYDSVALKSDLELGGTDQKFNLLVGRELQKEYGQEPQCILTMPLLVGTDGVEKMSKSKGNYIGISESPDSMFGKLMSISDTLMWRYFELLSFRSLEEIAALKQEIDGGRNPRDAKVMLAQEIIARFHSAKAADEALAAFEARFRDGAIPEDMPEVNIGGAPVGILKLLREAGLVASGSEAQRNVEQGGVRVNGDRVEDKSLQLPAGTYVVQVGKRKFARVNLNP